MKIDDSVLRNEEKAVLALRRLYRKYGYEPYRMSKFEEYDLYARNKDFLVSDNVITFTDTDGRLLALKPDVTLSIIKNSGDVCGYVKKVYYDENVYRVSKNSRSFREIMQTGLECIGSIDDLCICEVVALAAESLSCISEDYILDISHMGIVSAATDLLGVTEETKRRIIKCVSEKNACEIRTICRSENTDDAAAARICGLAELSGTAAEVLPRLSELMHGTAAENDVRCLSGLFENLSSCGLSDRLRIDFSVIHDTGIVFRGFINGIPTGILSGGQYDILMKKMNKKAGAIGFAVYLDMLDRTETDCGFDVDTVLLCGESTDAKEIFAAAQRLRAEGADVSVQHALPEKLRCRRVLKYQNGRLDEIG